MEKLIVSPSPHVRSGMTTQKIMLNVIIALCPAVIASGIIFGFRALFLILVCVATSLVWETLFNIITKKPNTIGDLSAVVTGILLAFNLPPSLPFWMAAIGTFVAIVIVKCLFGGLGQNFANPAIVGRIVLALSFTGAMTNWTLPQAFQITDAVTSATPLVTQNEDYLDLFLGMTGGCLGETCALALIIGGIYLVIRRIISPATPLFFLLTVGLFSFIVGADPLYQILSGGVLLGAIFMATDYVTTPITFWGKVIFGIGCGIITCVIRFYASMAEGVSFSILIMNILTPYIDMITKAKPVGAVKSKNRRD